MWVSFVLLSFFFFSSRRRHTRSLRDWSSDVCSSDLAVHVERNLVRGPNAGSDLSHPRLWPITECDGLVAGSAWSGDDLFLSMDRGPDAAVRDTKGIGWRRISGLRSHPAIYLAGQSRTCTPRARRCPLCAWDGPQHGRHSLHLGCIRFCEETGPANGDNIAQHCATSRRTDFDYALRDLPGMEVGNGTVQRQPLQRIYRCLSSTLRITRLPV